MKWLAPLACTLCLCASAWAQVPGVAPQKPYSLGGYVKYLATWSIPDGGDDQLDHLIHQRFNFEVRPTGESALAVGMRNRLFWGDSLDFPLYEELVTDDPGYWDLSWNWLNEEDVLGNTTLDRLYGDWRPGDYQLRFGRHRIGWGMATLWNPNDLFNVYSTYDVDYEERPGTDALLAGADLGFASRAELVWAFGHDWKEESFAGRYQWNVDGYDVQLLGGKNRGDLVTGAGFAGSARGAGVRGEVSWFHPRWDDELENAWVATVETDYAVTGNLNVIWKLALLYLSQPQDAFNTIVYLNQPLTARTLSFTRWTGYGDLSFDISPLSRQGLGASYYDDGSWFATASNAVSLAEDWDLLLVWQHFDGTGGSLFGENPLDYLFGRVQWSF